MDRLNPYNVQRKAVQDKEEVEECDDQGLMSNGALCYGCPACNLDCQVLSVNYTTQHKGPIKPLDRTGEE